MTDLVEFLLARIAEDEQRARECAKIYPAPWDMYDRGHSAKVQADGPHFRVVVDLDQDQVAVGEVRWLGDAIEHVARWNPARVLAECETKRRIVGAVVAWLDSHPDEDHVPAGDDALVWLALAYADHQDYREQWRP